MQNRSTIIQNLMNDIAEQLSATTDYLEYNILYDRNFNDITYTFRKQLSQAQTLLEKSQQSEQDFRNFQNLSNSLSLFIMATIDYPIDKEDFLQEMRKFLDLLGTYTSTCAPNAPAKAAVMKLFHTRSEDVLEPREKVKPLHKESYRHQ